MPERRGVWGIVGVLVILVGGASYWLMVRGYGEVSEGGYDVAMALYSACHRQDSARVQQIVEMLDESQRRGELPRQDIVWLRRIADRALSGQWPAACQSIRRLMEDQVRGAPPLPNLDP